MQKYRYHLLRCWASHEYPHLTQDRIDDYFKNGLTHGLYEEWVVLTEEEYEEYQKNPPNHDYLVKLISKTKMIE